MATLTAPNSSLLSLFCSVNFDKDRIVVAEHELTDSALIIYLEDRDDFKSTLDETVMVELPVAEFAKLIATSGINSYDGVKYSHSGRAYDARIEINEPIAWFEEDATTFERKTTIALVKDSLLKSTLL